MSSPSEVLTVQSSDESQTLDLTGKRLLICEEGLIDYNAHFYSWIKAIRKINQNAGAEVVVAANQGIVPAIRDEMDVHPVFSRNNWSDIYNSRGRLGRAFGILEHNWITYREVSRLLKQIGPVDCVLLPAVRNYHLMAWKRLCRKQLNSGFKRLVIFLLNSHAVYNDDFTDYSFKRSSNLMRRLVRSFKPYVESGQVILCGDSKVTCGEYERLTELPFRVFPSPGAALNLEQQSTPLNQGINNNAADGPTFVTLGVSYFDKGIDLLQTAILKHFEDRPDSTARFIVQWSQETIDYDGNRVEIQDALRNHPRVELLESTLSDEEYTAKFSSADFLVLPYRRKVYFNRISGVAVEAACSGIPMIVTENTWLSQALEQFGSGVTVQDSNAGDLLDKINYCGEHHAALKQDATGRQAVALNYNSAENYLQCQWK